jgi:hypothetical protein
MPSMEIMIYHGMILQALILWMNSAKEEMIL